MRDKAFNIAKNLEYDGYEHRLASVVYKFFDEETSGSGLKNENISKKELVKVLHKSIIRYFQKWKVHSSYIDNIWGADLVDLQLVSRFNKGICVLSCYWYLSKYASTNPLKDRKGITITNTFQKILDKSNRKTKQNMGW